MFVLTDEYLNECQKNYDAGVQRYYTNHVPVWIAITDDFDMYGIKLWMKSEAGMKSCTLSKDENEVVSWKWGTNHDYGKPTHYWSF